MVPYDQPEAALVSHGRAIELMRILTCPNSNFPGYDYSMGEGHPSDGLIGFIVFLYLFVRV